LTDQPEHLIVQGMAVVLVVTSE